MSSNRLPVRYNIEAYRGDSLTVTFRIVEVAEDGTETLLDTTGWTGRVQVRDSRRAGAALQFSGTTEDGALTTGVQSDGVIDNWSLQLDIAAADMAAFDHGFSGVYDIELTSATETKTYYTGTFAVEGDVSHDD